MNWLNGIGTQPRSRWLGRLIDIRAGEVRQVALLAALLFFLLAANNLIKIVRDALFLSRFPIEQLPYVYLLAALVAGVTIAAYARFTSRWSLDRIVLVSLLSMIASVIGFWLLVRFHGAAWVLYAYYVWSAIAGMVLVAQFWVIANDLFAPRDGKRLFGILTAGGTLGALLSGLVASWLVRYWIVSVHLLWSVAALLVAAAVVTAVLLRQTKSLSMPVQPAAMASDSERGVLATLFASPYLKTIAAIILVSVVVSTLIDFQFKAAAKLAYPNADGLADFLGQYYAWLGGVTLAVQLWLSGKLLLGFGLTPSLLILPFALLSGSVGLLIWPGLAAATATRLAEATLRTSVNQSGVQILYLPIPDIVKKRVKVFLDVTVERLGDGLAALVILAVSLTLAGNLTAVLSIAAVLFVVVWGVLVVRVRDGYLNALRQSLQRGDMDVELVRIDFADRATVAALLASLDVKDEPTILFALGLAEKLPPQSIAAHLPAALWRHPSATVRQRTLALMAKGLEPNLRELLFELLSNGGGTSRAEALQALAADFKISATPALRALLHSNAAAERRVAIQLMLRGGDDAARREALDACRALLQDHTPEGDARRIEAAFLIGEVGDPALCTDLVRLIEQDSSPPVIQEAIAAAAKAKYPAAIIVLIACLGERAKRVVAREALVAYGESAIKALRSALSDDRIAREVRSQVPTVLSKIPAQGAMNALMDGLLDDDRAIRFKAIVAVAEMHRRYPELIIDREVVESALLSDAQLFAERRAIFAALFETGAPAPQESLLYVALQESMERVRQRAIWLLGLIYLARDVQSVWSALQSADAHRRGHAVELLDNLLKGELQKHILPLYDEGAVPDQSNVPSTHALEAADGALQGLLAQPDRWLKAAAVWEIGVRRLSRFRPTLVKLTTGDDIVMKETAGRVLQRL